MFNRRSLGLAAAGFALCASARQATAKPDETGLADLNAALSNKVAPGGFVAVASGGTLRTFQSWGHASLPFQQPVTRQTLFHLGSCGKQITAIAALKLHQAGRIDLRQPASLYLDDLPSAWADIAVHHLLSHTSGLPDYLDVFETWDRPQPRSEILDALKRLPLHFSPGSAWSYSNTGYLLLGSIIEAASAEAYGDYLAQNLFLPANLPTARIDAAGDVIARRAEPYAWRDDRIAHAIRMESSVSAAADGGVLMSAIDFALWQHAIESGVALDSRVLDRAFVPAPLTTGRSAPYNCGAFLEESRGRRVRHHSGATPGFRAHAVAFPDEGISALAVANYDGPRGVRLEELAAAAVEASRPGLTWLSLPNLRPDRRSRLLHGILTRESDETDMTPLAAEMRALAGMNRLRRMSVEEILPVESWSLGPVEMVRYRIRFRSEIRHLVGGWTADERLFWLG